MRPTRLDIDVAAADPDGIADLNTSNAAYLTLDGAGLTAGHDADGIAATNVSTGTSLVLDGVLTAGGVYKSVEASGHRITIADTDTTDQTGATFVVTGKDQNSQPVVELIVGPGSGLTVFSLNVYSEISSIVIQNAASAAVVSVGPMGSFTSADGLAHRISIIDTATQVQTDSVFTFVGTDADDRPQTYSRAGPGSGATVETVNYFKTITWVGITGGDASDTVDVGTVDEVASKTIVLDHYEGIAPTVQVDVTGTIDFDIEVTVQSPFDNDAAPFDLADQEDLAWVNDANFTGKTADLIAALAAPGRRAMRVVANSYSATAELQVYITQPRAH